jgi:hypothetical protein
MLSMTLWLLTILVLSLPKIPKRLKGLAIYCAAP